MTVNILFHTINFCGDHAADISVAVTPIEGETVDQLVKRVGFGREYAAMIAIDRSRAP